VQARVDVGLFRTAKYSSAMSLAFRRP